MALGRTVDVVWEDDVEQITLSLLSTDDDMKRCLIKEGVDVEVIGFPDGYWIISNREASRPSLPKHVGMLPDRNHVAQGGKQGPRTSAALTVPQTQANMEPTPRSAASTGGSRP